MIGDFDHHDKKFLLLRDGYAFLILCYINFEKNKSYTLKIMFYELVLYLNKQEIIFIFLTIL